MPGVVETAAGTIISISAEQPLTFDANGYADTGMDWSVIGEITDGGEHGREYAEVVHNPVASRGTKKYKGSFNEGTKTLAMAIDDDDVGQVLLNAALASDNDYSFRVAYSGGGKDYFQAKVMSFKKSATSVDSIRSATVNLAITSNSAGVGVVQVATP